MAGVVPGDVPTIISQLWRQLCGRAWARQPRMGRGLRATAALLVVGVVSAAINRKRRRHPSAAEKVAGVSVAVGLNAAVCCGPGSPDSGRGRCHRPDDTMPVVAAALVPGVVAAIHPRTGRQWRWRLWGAGVDVAGKKRDEGGKWRGGSRWRAPSTAPTRRPATRGGGSAVGGCRPQPPVMH